MRAKQSSFSRRHSPSWVVLHSLVILLGLVSLLTGLRIATQTRPEILGFTLLLPQGDVHGWHFLSAMGLLAIVAAYLVHVILFRESRLPINRAASPYHRLVFWIGRLIAIVSLVTGGMLFFDGFTTAVLVEIHYYCALGWLLYLLIHGGVYFAQHGLTSLSWIVVPGRLHVARDVLVLVAALAVFGTASNWSNNSGPHSLLVRQVGGHEQVRIDGIADETAWEQADSITVNTIGGLNFVNGQTPITLKAIHNGTGVFFHIRWDDPSKSLQHLPLVKTESGWKVSESGFYRFDETKYYEDKLAVIVSQNCGYGGAETAQLGPRPLAEKPPNWHGKGYHYATDDKVHDLWHWKAVRTNDMFLADDNLIGAPDVVRSGSRRYTAGYLADPRESGAYWMNWKWYKPTGIVPRRMPKQPGDLAPYQAAEAGDQSWYIPWYSYDHYAADRDKYPVGTIMPSVLHMSNRFEGDRADVFAHGTWADGQWSLELMRRIDTGSEWDVALEQGVCLWVAAFDHAQVAHTRHARPIRLTFEHQDD